MDRLDRELLDVLQRSLPLVARPFLATGDAFGITEAETLSRIRRMKKSGIIRQIGPIFSSRHLGYQSTLATFRVEVSRLEAVAALISSHPGVSHNYSRNHHYNLWFTLTLPRSRSLDKEIARLAAQAAVTDYLNLPSVRMFKLGVHFPMAGDLDEDALAPGSRDRAQTAPTTPPVAETGLTAIEREVVRVLQGDMLLVSRPFQRPAAQMGVEESRLLEIVCSLDERGVMRRFAAVLKHRQAGFTANGMGCWVVPRARIVEVGEEAASFAAVSHCYQRRAHPPRWPYNLFTMVHGQNRKEVESAVDRIQEAIGPFEHTILYSQKEYKKERVRYFVEQEGQ